MKPRFVESETLSKAREMAVRLDSLEKARECPKCDDGKLDKAGNCMKMGCGGPTKMQKAKGCPECGAKMEKGACLKAGCATMAKADDEQQKEKITNVNPHFLTETGGQTRTAYYSTRDRPIETEDAKPKRKKDDKKVNIEGLASRMNPHEGTGVDREDSEGGPAPIKKSRDLRAATTRGAPTICRNCGATSASGCRVHNGMDMFACPGFEPMI